MRMLLVLEVRGGGGGVIDNEGGRCKAREGDGGGLRGVGTVGMGGMRCAFGILMMALEAGVGMTLGVRLSIRLSAWLR